MLSPPFHALLNLLTDTVISDSGSILLFRTLKSYKGKFEVRDKKVLVCKFVSACMSIMVMLVADKDVSSL